MTAKGAWKGCATLKAKFIDRLEEHRRLEHLKQGIGFDNDREIKGCNIGCLFDYYDHAKGAKESGIPEILLRLADIIFEGLSKEDADRFAIAWPRAIRPGANLDLVHQGLAVFILRKNIKRVLALKNITDDLRGEVVTAIRGVLSVFEEAVKSGEPITKSAAIAAAGAAARALARATASAVSAARNAAASAASSAYGLADNSYNTAWAAAESAGSVAESVDCVVWATAANADNAARRAVASAAYKTYAKKFIRLLAEAR